MNASDHSHNPALQGEKLVLEFEPAMGTSNDQAGNTGELFKTTQDCTSQAPFHQARSLRPALTPSGCELLSR